MLFFSSIQSAAVTAALVFSFLPLSSAGSFHAHNQQKREAVVVTEYRTVYYTPPPKSTVVVSAPAGSQAPAPESEAPAQPQSQAPAQPQSQAPAQPQSQSSSSSSSSPPSQSSSPNDNEFNAGAMGITYSPYTPDGGCKSLQQVQSDLSLLKGYSIIRLYGVDCNQVENVLQAKQSNQKLFLGIFFVDQISQGISQIASAISTYGSWDHVHTVSIGNELVNDGKATVDQISSYVSQARPLLKNAGYNGPVVSVDTFIAVINNPGLCAFSDYMAVNAHAYFDQNTAAPNSGNWVQEQINRVHDACNKNVLIVETGWPYQGDTLGKAVPSVANQQAAISSIKSVCGSSSFLFNAYDDLWKQNGPYNVEKYWGVYGH